MGKISDMQNNQDKLNFNYVRKTNPKLDTKGIKNFYNKLRLAYKPGIEKEYALTRSQRKFARTIRGATAVGVAVLASSLTIGTIVSNHISRNDPQKETIYEVDNNLLDRKTVLDNAKSTLAEIIFPEGHIYHDSAYVSFPSRNEYRAINSVQVSPSNKYDDPKYRYISESKTTNKNNSETFNQFVEKLLEIANTSVPSQEDLEELQELTEQISQMDLQLDGKNIVDLDEKESDFERD